MPNDTDDFQIPCVDDPNVPVVFVTEMTACGMVQDHCHMSFAVIQHDHSCDPPKAYRKTCLRLVLPLAAAIAASQHLSSKVQPATDTAPPLAAAKLN